MWVGGWVDGWVLEGGWVGGCKGNSMYKEALIAEVYECVCMCMCVCVRV